MYLQKCEPFIDTKYVNFVFWQETFKATSAESFATVSSQNTVISTTTCANNSQASSSSANTDNSSTIPDDEITENSNPVVSDTEMVQLPADTVVLSVS